MSSGCIKCWDTPCRCGYGYEHLKDQDLKEIIIILQNILKNRKEIKK